MARILLVDDVKLFRHLESVILGWRGYSIEEAATGEEALDKLENDPPDLALVDLTLPGMNGIEICKRIKSDPATASIPVIVVTSSGREDDIRQAVEAGCDDYLTKPLDDATLLSKVDALLGLNTRRRYPRISTNLQVSFEDFKGIFFEYTRDISRSGVFIEMSSPLPVGTRLRLSFSVPPPFDHPVLAYARVVRSVPASSEGPGGVGVDFIFLDENSEHIIDALVSSQEVFEQSMEVFSQVSYQTDNAPIGDTKEQGERLDAICEEQRDLMAAYRDLQVEHMKISSRLTIVENLHTARSPGQAISVALDVLGDILGVASCGIFLQEKPGDELIAVASRRLPPEISKRLMLSGPLEKAFRENSLEIPAPPWTAPDASWKLLAAVPVVFTGKTLGLISIHELYEHKSSLKSDDLHLLNSLGRHLGISLVQTIGTHEGQEGSEQDSADLIKLLLH